MYLTDLDFLRTVDRQECEKKLTLPQAGTTWPAQACSTGQNAQRAKNMFLHGGAVFVFKTLDLKSNKVENGECIVLTIAESASDT